ncbi:MAG: tRNA uridine-5-carboxymethylaminomethyl(34) synthesis GTPase MnmE [Spirochaetaceae bacterium]|nr:tRNA uridine-5-carboxymethylaminomethyl(34) synthesis GTPase MnmE [Spirochaetaceae bacterium]
MSAAVAARDTVVAVATPPGTGALAIVRLTGPQAIAAVAACFRGAGLRQAASHTAHHGYIVAGDEPVDDVVVTVFRAPRSYTGEDCVEITCHGNPLLAARIVDTLMAGDPSVAAAGPGEFTRRAFLSGKLDLSQAEAVADLIRGSADTALRGARARLDGAVAASVEPIREGLLDALSELEVELDFAEEEGDLVDRKAVRAHLETVAELLARAAEDPLHAELPYDGINAAILGPPNVGKSSILNRLAGSERAIVDAAPGTTRDVIREDLSIAGMHVRLVDTAGIRAGTSGVERTGIERTREAAAQADVAILVGDARTGVSSEVRAEVEALIPAARLIPVLNKADLLNGTPPAPPLDGALLVSARTGAGVPELASAVRERAAGVDYTERGAAVAGARHRRALRDALAEVEAARRLLAARTEAELVAVHLRNATLCLDEIVGVVTTDDILNRIFSRFCIGK